VSNVTGKIDPSKNPPTARIDVPTKSMDEIRRLEPEQTVRVVLEGKVKSIGKNAPDMDSFQVPGSLEIEVRRMHVVRQDNAFEEVAEDEG